MKPYIVSFLFLIINLFCYSQDTTNVQLPEDDTTGFEYKNIAFAIGLNSNSVEKFYCLGGDLDIQYRFDNNRQRIGLGFESMFSLNKKRYTVLQSDFFTGQISETNIGMRYFTLAWKIEYNYYLQDPNKNKLSTRIGINAGLALQIQTSDYFSGNTIIGDQYNEREELGFITGGVYGLEYTLEKSSLYAEIGLSYHYINNQIFVIENKHQIGGTIKFGIVFEIDKDTFNALFRASLRQSYLPY